MWLCQICDKPFAKESSHKRHVSYCRRNQNRPRARQRSCRSCNAAKVKCTFEKPCRRCTTKGLDCVYELASRATGDGLGPPNIIDLPNLTAQSSASFELPVEGNSQGFIAFDLDNEFGDEDHEFNEHLAVHDREPLAQRYPGSHRSLTVTPARTQTISYETETLANGFDIPYTFHAQWLPWINRITNRPYAPNLYRLASLPSGCLTLLQPSSLVVKHSTDLVVQALRAYPLMMLRRETFPPFIHPQWYSQSAPALPEPISNCMSIAQMYAMRNEDTKPFLWRTIQSESERIRSQRTNFSARDSLASLQAHIIYMIMRFVDKSSQPVDLNPQLVITYQLLCKQLMASCDEIFCEVDNFFIRPSWEDWVFDESRRRNACLFYLICRSLSINTGHECKSLFDRLLELPIASPKSLWEAKTRLEWESEYSAYSAMHDTGMHTMGMLIEAYKQPEDPIKSQLLDYWNCRADNFGNLLTIAASVA